MEEDRDIGLRRVRKPNFLAAIAAYAVLAILAGVTLNGPALFEKRLRILVWLLLGALAIKTWIHKKRAG